MSEEDMINPLELLGENEYLRNQLQQKEDIIKEVIEVLLNYGETFDLKVHQEMQKKLLEVLDKEVN